MLSGIAAPSSSCKSYLASYGCTHYQSGPPIMIMMMMNMMMEMMTVVIFIVITFVSIRVSQIVIVIIYLLTFERQNEKCNGILLKPK